MLALAKKSKSGSPEFMRGYRDGVTQANEDINSNSNQNVIHGFAKDVVCPSGSTPDYCAGYKQGYAHTATDQLE